MCLRVSSSGSDFALAVVSRLACERRLRESLLFLAHSCGSLRLKQCAKISMQSVTGDSCTSTVCIYSYNCLQYILVCMYSTRMRVRIVVVFCRVQPVALVAVKLSSYTRIARFQLLAYSTVKTALHSYQCVAVLRCAHA